MLRDTRAIAKEALAASPNPDVILLLIGINDLIVNRNAPEATLSRMGELLDELAEYAPDAEIIVGNLIPNASDDPVIGYVPSKTYVNSEDKVRRFNRGLPGVIESKKAEGIKVEWVDLHSRLTREDLADGIHPNKNGYDRIASAWFEALMNGRIGRRVVIKNGDRKTDRELPNVTAGKAQSTHVVETFTGPVFDLSGWIDSGADTDGFTASGQFTIKSPYRGLRRTVGKGTFESLFELKNIRFRGSDSTIHLGFVPHDPKSKVILQIRREGVSLIFRDLDSTPAVNQRYDEQTVFETRPRSLKVRITWDEPEKQWRIFYGVDNEPETEIPASRKGLFFTDDIDASNEALIFIQRGSVDVDHFEFGAAVHGSAFYGQLPAEQSGRGQVKSGSLSGRYYDCEIPAGADGSFVGAKFRLWIPQDLALIRGIIVRQHGTGGNGKRFAHDLQFQALAKKHDFALMGTFMKATDDFYQWPQPDKGSGDAFLRALQILARKSGHPEIKEVPWVLWGHSAGGQWANKMAQTYPNRVPAVISRSGHGSEYVGNNLDIPNLQIAGEQEVDRTKPWFRSFMTRGELRVRAIEPGTGHACANSRLLTVAFIEGVMDRLAEQNQQRLKRSGGWLGDITTGTIAPYASFEGDKYEACWLPNEDFAHKWKEFIASGKIADSTPPPGPTGLKATMVGDGQVQLRWRAEADVESGLKRFNVYRNRKKVAVVRGQGWNRGDEPDPVDCIMQYTYREQQGTENPRELEHASYQVTSVNFADLESEKSTAVTRTLLR
jgi:pimeloyl-ACP methyl ester carboxylesterase